jgi:hypothetical protein
MVELPHDLDLFADLGGHVLANDLLFRDFLDGESLVVFIVDAFVYGTKRALPLLLEKCFTINSTFLKSAKVAFFCFGLSFDICF